MNTKTKRQQHYHLNTNLYICCVGREAVYQTVSANSCSKQQFWWWFAVLECCYNEQAIICFISSADSVISQCNRHVHKQVLSGLHNTNNYQISNCLACLFIHACSSLCQDRIMCFIKTIYYI